MSVPGTNIGAGEIIDSRWPLNVFCDSHIRRSLLLAICMAKACRSILAPPAVGLLDLL